MKPTSILDLEPSLIAPIEELLCAFDSHHPEIVHCPVHSTSPASALSTITASGESRFANKLQRMVADVEALGADEALYRHLAESLGYFANRDAFRKLAEHLPWALLSSLPPLQIERDLLCAAGLTAQDGLLSAYIEGPILGSDELVTFRVRAGNHPATRLRGLARLIHLHRHGLADAIFNKEITTLGDLVVVEADTVLIGRSRADDIVINVALPYLAAYQGVDGPGALANLPAPEDNRWVKSLRKKLHASGVTLRPYRALHQQGLLDLSLRFCRYDHCEACPFTRGCECK